MTTTDHVARVSTIVDAPRARVWEALVDPEAISRFMFGAKVTTDWREGSPITWEGEWKGQTFQDKGMILGIEPPRTLSYSHFSPLAGLPDVPENYHTVAIELEDVDSDTRVIITQDNNDTPEAREHSEENWSSMLKGLKQVVEEG